MQTIDQGVPGAYSAYSAYLRRRYGGPVHRVAVDAGFSCPHRERSADGRGCSFCGAGGSRAPYVGDLKILEEQIVRGLSFLRRRYRAERFMLYFQAFSSTHAHVETLRAVYDRGLSTAPYVGLVVATRPDCLDRERVELLASYLTDEREVWVELGLQSASEVTLRRINRGHGVAEFVAAHAMLRAAGIRTCAHLIFGLPGESLDDMLDSVRFIAALDVDGVKIHNLHVPLDCPLHEEYLCGEISVPCAHRHLEAVIKAVELLPPRTLIMRLICDTPLARLAAPLRFPDKGRFLDMFRRRLIELGSWQGRLYRPASSSAVSNSSS